jgi:voltage-gated potassium channel
MKFISAQISYYLSDRTVRQNVRSLIRLLVFLFLVITVFAVLFHFIMLYEGRQHSWVTGFYWVLTVMSTLGFGDITFESDLGRVFSILVLITGVLLLLIVLPFAFIRYFYAPWLEAQIHLRAPRSVPEDVSGHIIVCSYETVVEELTERFKDEDIPYFILEPDPVRAAQLRDSGLSIVTGDIDSPDTYRALRVNDARLVLANSVDTVNTSITLTVREVSPDVPLVAIAGSDASVDVLELSGATHVLPLKRWLGEQLANRVAASHAQSHVVGHYRDLQIAELPVRHTPLAGKTIRETRLREITGVSIIAVWERGRLHPARPDLLLTDQSVPIVTGTADQLDGLDELLLIYDYNPNPVIVIGGGKVGRATARALREKEIPVNLIERDPAVAAKAAAVCDRVIEGDAADHDVLEKAGLDVAPSLIITTHDDAVNIFLSSYCRRLNPDLRIVSRVSHERNVESIHRAGADFVLSYATLGAASVMAILHGKQLMVLGEGFDLFSVPLPASLKGKTLAESAIGSRTGLIVLGIQQNGTFIGNPPAHTRFLPGAELVLLGGPEQRHEFAEIYH